MIRHVELFAGIGGFRQALDTLTNDTGLVQKTIAYSEVDKYAQSVYKAAHAAEDEICMRDIVDFCEHRLHSLPDFDLLTGGFPCQPFSMMGGKRGFQDPRGTMFFYVLKILQTYNPPYVLLENVRNLITHDNGNTFQTIVSLLKQAGYRNVYADTLNTADFGLAQTRRRVFIFGAKNVPKDFEFTRDRIKEYFDISASSLRSQTTTHDVLSPEVSDRYWLSDKMKEFILSNGTKGFHAKSEINPLVARPLTASMTKMHRASQDNYFSEGYIATENPEEYSRKKFTKAELIGQNIRRITPEEAFKLQGFSGRFIASAMSSGVSDAQLYRQAGNAVSVNTVYAILRYLSNALGW